MEQNELKHYGVPGMKWGVRKATKEERKAVRLTGRQANKDFRKYASSLAGASRFHLTKKGGAKAIDRFESAQSQFNRSRNAFERAKKDLFDKETRISQIKTNLKNEYMRGKSATSQTIASFRGLDVAYMKKNFNSRL